MEQQLERIRADLVAAQNDKKRMEAYGDAYVPQDTAPVAEKLTVEQGKLDRMNEQLQIAGMSLARVANATSAAEAGYQKLFLPCGGADAPRPVKLRQRGSDGKWLLWEQYLLTGVRLPKAEDPWA